MGTRAFWKSSDSLPEFTQADRRILRDIFGGGDSPPPPPAPDYAPMQAASDHAAELGYELGNRQLGESYRQYEKNMAVAQPVIDAQLAAMRQNQAQGQDYYDYMVRNQRPVENALNAQSMNPDLGGQAAGRAEILGLVNRNAGQDVDARARMMGMVDSNAGQDAAARARMMGFIDSNAAQDASERALMTGGDAGVYNARRGDIDWQVGNAAGDARRGQAQNANMMMRQGLRYGYAPARLAAMAGQMATSNASQQAAASNAARTSGIAGARGLMGQDYAMRNQTAAAQLAGMGQDYDLRNRSNAAQLAGLGQDYAMRNQTAANQIAGQTNNRNYGIQDQSINWGRQMDVAGLYRGLPGASQGAYGLANNAGNSAVANSMQPGNQLLTGMAQGAGMQQQGVGQQLTGLGGVLSAQGSYNNMMAGMQNAQTAANGQASAGLGQFAGMMGSAAMTPSGQALIAGMMS